MRGKDTTNNLQPSFLENLVEGTFCGGHELLPDRCGFGGLWMRIEAGVEHGAVVDHDAFAELNLLDGVYFPLDGGCSDLLNILQPGWLQGRFVASSSGEVGLTASLRGMFHSTWRFIIKIMPVGPVWSGWHYYDPTVTIISERIMKVPELRMFSKDSQNRQPKGGAHLSRDPSPSFQYRARMEHPRGEQPYQSKSAKGFYSSPQNAKTMEYQRTDGLSTATHTGFYRSFKQSAYYPPEMPYPISNAAKCGCVSSLCNCGIHSLTGYVPVSTLNTQGQQYFNRTLEKLNGQYGNPHPEGCERCRLHINAYKLYIPGSSELCEHYRSQRDLITRALKGTKPANTKSSKERLDETERLLRVVRAKIQAAATVPSSSENANRQNLPLPKFADEKQTVEEKHRVFMGQLEMFYDKDIVQAALSVIRHYQILIANEADLKAILDILHSISQKGAQKEHKQAAAMNQIRQWYQERTTTTKTVTQPPQPPTQSKLAEAAFKERLDKASESLQKYATKIEKKLQSPRPIMLDSLVRIKNENGSLGRNLMHDMDELISQTVDYDDLISLQSLNYLS